MTAQTNDPLSAFAYPQATNTPVTPTDSTVTPPVSNQPLTAPLQNDTNRGNEINGPEPVVADPSLLEPEPPKTVDTFSPAQVVTPDAPQEEDEHDSPLQALAKKLAKLREDLIQESPEQPAMTTDQPVQPVVNTETVASVAPTPAPQPDILSSNSMSASLTTPIPTVVNPLPTLEATENVTPDLSSLNTSLTAPVSPVEMPIPQEVTPVASEVVNPLPTVTDTVPDVLSTNNPPVAPSVTTPTSTLQQMFPEVVSQPSDSTATVAPFDPTAMPSLESTPAVSTDVNVTPGLTQAAVSTVSESTVIDENDNSEVNAEQVELASANSKYPLTINKIMDIAIERGASDIQVSVGYPVMIRIDGTLLAVHEQIISPSNAEELIMPVLSEQKKELLEVNREVDLAYSPLHNTEARFRINAYYSKGNLTAAFRLIPSKIRTIEELMLPPIYNQLIKLGQGLVLVTGPTGHGKSTTLAAMLQSINTTRAVHMLTIEDPIEYVFKPAKAVIDQREMHDDTHSWTVALKSALRQDPDVILVGEMRDYETIASTVTLAETGHLVFATLHTNSAAQTVDRIIDVFPENQQAQIRTQLSNILEAVVAQRLIPIDGGGRRAVSEIMLGVPAVRNLIREGKTHQLDNVIRTSADIGMISLEQSLVKLVRDGLITMERAQEYAVHPEEVVRLLKS